jgi:hypothetical protein
LVILKKEFVKLNESREIKMSTLLGAIMVWFNSNIKLFFVLVEIVLVSPEFKNIFVG